MNSVNKEHSEPKPRCEIIGLDKVYKLAKSLSENILDAGYQPDVIIAIARGGFVPARLACDFFEYS